MNFKVFYITIYLFPLFCNSEDTLTIDISDTSSLINYFSQIEETEKLNNDWFQSLIEKGVSSNEDQLLFSKEGIKLLNDSSFRSKIYKDDYSLYDVSLSLSNMDIKLAFWQIINIYPEKKDTLIKFVLAYDEILPVDEIILASFYTYAFFDPKITNLENGKPKVYRPDLFEDYFRRTKEIIYYLNFIRGNKKSI